MAELSEEQMKNLVPFEIGIQATETILMWAFGFLFYILTFVFMAFAVDWELNILGVAAYGLGGVFMFASQFFSKYNPLYTTKIPILGIILWVVALFLVLPIILQGWMIYSSTNVVILIVVYLILAILITGGLLVANFLTSLKIFNWMSMDVVSYSYTMGLLFIIASVTYTGFNHNALLDIEEVGLGKWALLFLFSISFLLMLELNSGAHRFNEIIIYAKKRAGGDFSLTPVINNYYIMGFILMVIIGVAILGVLLFNFFMRWVTRVEALGTQQLANSVMMNSVYSVVFSIAIIFIPIWIVLILWMEYRNRKEAKEEEARRKKREKENKLGGFA